MLLILYVYICYHIACIGPPPLSNARLIGPPDKVTLIGKTRKYKCEKDYFETGLVEVICNPDLTWQETGFRCKGTHLKIFILRTGLHSILVIS